jgi:hypothetical protein
MAPPLVLPQMKVQKYFLFSRNLANSTPFFHGDVTSPNNVARCYGISNYSNSQQPIEIDVPLINLINSPSTKKTN